MITTIVFSFFYEEKYTWILSIVTFTLSGWQFFKHFFEKPNYNEFLQLYIAILNGIYFWACCVLLFAHIFKGYGFNGAIYLFLFGIPLISLLIIVYSDNKIKILQKKLSHFQKGEDIQLHIRYFVKLVEEKNEDSKSDLLMKGFIFNHEKNCELLDCPINDYLSLKNEKTIKNLSFAGESNIEKNNPDFFLLMYADKVYNLGLTRFPNCTPLRLKYGAFLWERFKNKNSALQQLNIAERYNPPLDQKFTIYRYKKIISEDEENNKNFKDESLDLVSGIAYESHYKQCFINVEKSSQLYLDFWELLLSNNATLDIGKLNDLGIKINIYHINIENHWKAMQKIKPNSQKALRLYSNYLINVLNDKTKGSELMSFYRETLDKKQMLFSSMNITIDENILSYIKEGSGFIICRNDLDPLDKNYGMITKVSSATCKIFGYLENELISKNLECLFLELYKESINFYIYDNLKQYKIINDQILINNSEFDSSSKSIQYQRSHTKTHLISENSNINTNYRKLSQLNIIAKNKKNFYKSSTYNSNLGNNTVSQQQQFSNISTTSQNKYISKYQYLQSPNLKKNETNTNSNINVNENKRNDENLYDINNATNFYQNNKYINYNNTNRFKNIFHNYISGELFFGKTKNQKAIPIFMKILNFPSLLAENRSFIVVVNNENNILDIKNNIKSGFFIINSAMKLTSSVFSSNTTTILSTLNRKMHENMEHLYNVFPEILKKNNIIDLEENEVFDNENKAIFKQVLSSANSSKNVNMQLKNNYSQRINPGKDNKLKSSCENGYTSSSNYNTNSNNNGNFYYKNSIILENEKENDETLNLISHSQTTNQVNNHSPKTSNNSKNNSVKKPLILNIIQSNNCPENSNNSVLMSPLNNVTPSHFKSNDILKNNKSHNFNSYLNLNSPNTNNNFSNGNNYLLSNKNNSSKSNNIGFTSSNKNVNYTSIDRTSDSRINHFEKECKLIYKLKKFEKELVEKHLAKTIINLNNEPIQCQLRKKLPYFDHENNKEMSLPDINSDNDYFTGECSVVSLPILRKRNISPSLKKKSYFFEQHFCFFLKLHCKQLNKVKNINIGNLKANNQLYFDLKRLSFNITSETSERYKHILSHVKDYKGGIANYYSLYTKSKGENIKDIFNSGFEFKVNKEESFEEEVVSSEFDSSSEESSSSSNIEVDKEYLESNNNFKIINNTENKPENELNEIDSTYINRNTGEFRTDHINKKGKAADLNDQDVNKPSPYKNKNSLMNVFHTDRNNQNKDSEIMDISDNPNLNLTENNYLATNTSNFKLLTQKSNINSINKGENINKSSSPNDNTNSIVKENIKIKTNLSQHKRSSIEKNYKKLYSNENSSKQIKAALADRSKQGKNHKYNISDDISNLNNLPNSSLKKNEINSRISHNYNNNKELKEQSKVLNSSYILSINSDKISSQDIKELMFRMINYGIGIKPKLIHLDSIRELDYQNLYGNSINTINYNKKLSLDKYKYFNENLPSQVEEIVKIKEYQNYLNDEFNSNMNVSNIINSQSLFVSNQKLTLRERMQTKSKTKENYNETPRSLKFLFIQTVIILLVIIFYITYEFVHTKNQFDTFHKQINLLDLTCNLNINLQMASLFITELTIAYNGLYRRYYDIEHVDKETHVDIVFKYLTQTSFWIENKIESILDIDTYILPELDYLLSQKTTELTYFNLLEEDEIEWKPYFDFTNETYDTYNNFNKEGFSINENSKYFELKKNFYKFGIKSYETYLYTYIHALKTHSSFLNYIIADFKLSQFKDNDKYILQYLFNSFNSVFVNTLEISKLLNKTINEQKETHKKNLILFTCISLVLYVFCSISTTMMLGKVQIERQKILYSLYKLPVFYIKWLSEVCGRFLIKLQRNEVGDSFSNPDEEDICNMDLDEIEHNYGMEYKKRKINHYNIDIHANNYSNFKNISFSLLFIIVYFIAVLILNLNSLEKIGLNNDQLFNISNLRTNYTYSFNAMRLRVYNPLLLSITNTSATFSSESKDISNAELYQFDSQLFEYINITLYLVNEVFTEFVNNFNIEDGFYIPFCGDHTTYNNQGGVNTRNCYYYSKDAISDYGLLMMSQKLQNTLLRKNYYYYEELITSNRTIYYNPETNNFSYKKENDYIDFLVYQVLNSDSFLQGERILWQYFITGVEFIKDSLFEYSESIIKNIKNSINIVFFICLFLSLMLYIFFNYTIVKLKEDVRYYIAF